MEDLTTWQMIIIIISFGAIFIGICRIIFTLGDYLGNKANYYKAKLRILKVKNTDIFNKWYD